MGLAFWCVGLAAPTAGGRLCTRQNNRLLAKRWVDDLYSAAQPLLERLPEASPGTEIVGLAYCICVRTFAFLYSLPPLIVQLHYLHTHTRYEREREECQRTCPPYCMNGTLVSLLPALRLDDSLEGVRPSLAAVRIYDGDCKEMSRHFCRYCSCTRKEANVGMEPSR